MKGVNDGIINEKNFREAYNGKEYKKLNDTQKKFVNQINNKVKEDTVIYSENFGGRGYKPDISLYVLENETFVSLKKGSGNSVHQEKTSFFIRYCTTELDMTLHEKESLLLYLYGDGTLDGDSLVEERLVENELNEKYKNEIISIQNFFNRNIRNLVERFLIYGRKGKKDDIRADYIYHGTADKGVWSPLDDIGVDLIVESLTKGNPTLSIGPLTFQVWNRNPFAKTNLEDRRHSIQVKWPSIKDQLLNNNYEYLKKMEIIITKHEREIGNNKQGFDNQKNIIKTLHENRYKNLPSSMKKMIKTIFPTVANTDVVLAKEVKKNSLKPRMTITINDVKKNISVFMGSGNAIHQEKTMDFIEFSKDELEMTSEEEVSLLKVLFGDGTLDGQSFAKDRLTEKKIKNKYAEEIKIARKFLDRNKKNILERALVYGKNGINENVKSDFLYYGTVLTGRCLPYPLIIEKLMEFENSNTALLPVGVITMQIWNRNLDAKANLENRRYSVQLKWGSMKKILNEIYVNYELNNKDKYDGDWEEFELVSKLNRSRKIDSEIWKLIANTLNICNLSDVYAIKNTNTVYSKLVDRNVLPKADVFLVRCNLPKGVLLDNNFWIDDEIINEFDYSIITESGISCKRSDSKSFTYAKLSINAFLKLFENKFLGAGISLFVNSKDLLLNSKILNAWDIEEDEFYKYFNSSYSNCDENLENLDYCKQIKKMSIEKIQKKTLESASINSAIFSGKGVFEEPYSANYIYKSGKLNKSYIPSFSITTGSGRHKGIYTIVFKPK